MKLHRAWIDDPPAGSPPEPELHERIAAPRRGLSGFFAERLA